MTAQQTRRAPKMAKADQRRWRQVRAVWLAALRERPDLYVGLCTALRRCEIRHSWPSSVHDRLRRQLGTYRPTGARAYDSWYWWPVGKPLRAKGNQARLCVLNELAGFPSNAGPGYTERKKPARKETR